MAQRMARIAQGAQRDVSMVERLVQAIPNHDRSVLNVRVVRADVSKTLVVVRLLESESNSKASAQLLAYLSGREFPVCCFFASFCVDDEFWVDGEWVLDRFVAHHIVRVFHGDSLKQNLLRTVHANSVARFMGHEEEAWGNSNSASTDAMVAASADLIRDGSVVMRDALPVSTLFLECKKRWTTPRSVEIKLDASFESTWGREVATRIVTKPFPRHVAVHADADTARTLALLVSVSRCVPADVRVNWDAHFVDCFEEDDEFAGVTLWVGNASLARAARLCSPLVVLPCCRLPLMAPSPHKKIVSTSSFFAAASTSKPKETTTTVVCSSTPWQLSHTDIAAADVGVVVQDEDEKENENETEVVRVLGVLDLVRWCARHRNDRPHRVRFVAASGASVRAEDIVAAYECATHELHCVNVAEDLVRSALRSASAA